MSLLSECPVQFSTGQVRLGERLLEGDQYGAFFVYPRSDSEKATVGVVTATGDRGMKAAYANLYLLNGTTFPDLLLFDHTVLQTGVQGVRVAGFFGNDWGIEGGDFVWR